MKDYQLRVVIELAELNIKYNGLEKYICDNPMFKELDVDVRELLIQQKHCMKDYIDVLTLRLESFSE